MWFKELGDIMDVLPYYLLVCLPVFIALSPINPVEAAQVIWKTLFFWNGKDVRPVTCEWSIAVEFSGIVKLTN